jgi:hypothetical protein
VDRVVKLDLMISRIECRQLAGLLFDLLIDPDDGRSTFFQTINVHLPFENMAPHPRRFN